MKVQRQDLQVGHFYYLDDSKKNVGLLVEKDEDTLYFDCGASSTYMRSPAPDKKHLTPFAISFGSPFESVI